MAMKPLEPKKEWFLYLMMEDLMCRLNIDEFCKKNSPKPQFEVVHDFYPHDEYQDTTLPHGMHPIVVDSKVYMVGGESRRTCDDVPESNESDEDDDDNSGDGEINSLDDQDRARRACNKTRLPNLDVFAFDPEGPTISLSDGRTIPRRIIDPRLIDPKTLSGPIVFTLENKIYVMARAPYSGDEKDIDHQPTLFKVFDPLHQFWKELPCPPHCDYDYDNDHSFYDHCTWGHNLLVRNNRGGLHFFNTHQEKWEDLPREKGDELAFDTAVVEFEGFLIGVKRRRIGVYQLDENGIPKLCRDLHELKGIFCPFLLVRNCVMGKCDGGRMWLVYTGKDLMEFYYTRVAVFRVSIEVDIDDNPVISAQLEAAEFYYFQSRYDDARLTSSFSICHHSNTGRGDIEEKNLCGTILEHDHPRG